MVYTPNKAGQTSSRHRADLACLGKLTAGARVEHAKQRERQGCMPGMVYYDKLGDCELGDFVRTTRGVSCTGTPRHSPACNPSTLPTLRATLFAPAPLDHERGRRHFTQPDATMVSPERSCLKYVPSGHFFATAFAAQTFWV